MDETFINPYTFVPLPKQPPEREKPAGHLGDPDRLSGTLQITITATAPLLIRRFPADKAQDEWSRLPSRPDGTPMIPGSALKGALRSLHETLTGSCLRVLDSDFVPVYRDASDSDETAELRPALIAQHESEKDPPLVRFCEPGDPQVDRVGQDQLEKLNNEAPLTSGELLAVHTRDEKNRPVNVTRATEADGPENQWVLFLTESSAREKHKPYRAHIRKRTAKTKTARVTEHAWADYLDELEGTGDQRTAEVEARSSTETTTPVTFTHAPKKGPERTLQLGHRHLASALLSPGQPVWVRTNKDRSEVHELRLSMLWRHLANTHTPDKRAGNFRACQDETSLCPSCQVFGSAQDLSEAGNGSAESEGARQHSYRGHVRFGDAHVEGAVAPMQVIVPPLGKPNPGSGQFYLVTDGTHRDNAAKKPPLREWGSIADAGTPRELRGRKYYWHTPTDSDKLPERAKKRDHHSAKMVSHAEAFPTGTQFTATLAFTDLSRAQLGGLLATLDPGPLLNADGLHQHVGGGRPLGYGSCQISIDGKDSQVWRSGARYGGAGDVESLSDPSELLSDFRRSALPRLRETWKLLAKALNPDSVDPDKVSYPPGASWARRGQLQFDRGFEFWKQTSGAELERDKNGSRAGYPLTPLPDLAQSDQELPIVPKATKKRLPNQQSPGGKRR